MWTTLNIEQTVLNNQRVELCPSVQVDMSDVAISFISSDSTSQMTQTFMGLCCKTKKYLFNNMVLYMMTPKTFCTFNSFRHLKYMVRNYRHLLGNYLLNDFLNPGCTRVQTDLFPRSFQGGSVLKNKEKKTVRTLFLMLLHYSGSLWIHSEFVISKCYSIICVKLTWSLCLYSVSLEGRAPHSLCVFQCVDSQFQCSDSVDLHPDL